MKRFAGSERGRDLLVLTLLSAVLALLFFDVLFLGSNFFRRDFAVYHHPMKFMLRSVVRSGELPLWNPYISAGQPMAANPQHQVFYPPAWLTLFFDYDLSFRLLILLHFLIALVGMYSLLRSAAASRATASFGAVAFVLGGAWLSLVHLLPFFFATAWIPSILLFARRFFIRPNTRDLAWAALLIAMQCTIGEPLMLLQTWFLIAGCAWLERARLRMVLLPIAIGIVVAAVQLIPAADLARDSVRSRGFDYSLVTTWSMPAVRTLEIIWPHLLGHLDDDGAHFEGRQFYDGRTPFVERLYFGMLPAVLLLGGLIAYPRRSLFPLAVIAPLLLLAAGGHTPLFRWLYDLGIARSIRYPEKFVIGVIVVLTIAAALLFGRGVAGDRRLLLCAAMAAALIAVVSLVLAATPWGVRADWLIAAAKAGAAALLLGLGLRSTSRTWQLAAVAFLLIDVAPAVTELAPRMPRPFWSEPAVARTLDPRRGSYRIYPEAAHNLDGAEGRVFLRQGESAYWTMRNGMFPMFPPRWGFFTAFDSDYDRTALLPTADFIRALYAVQDSGAPWARETFMRMTSSRYVTLFRNPAVEFRRARAWQDVQPVDFIDAGPAPRYYFADQLVSVRGVDDFIVALKARPWSPRVAFVEGAVFAPAAGAVESVAETANSIDLRVRSSGKGYVVLSVTPHKYWRGTIDGAAATLLRTNVGFQGLVVPPGEHRIRLLYRNDLMLWSAGLSLLAFLAVLGLAVWNQPFGTPVVRRVPEC